MSIRFSDREASLPSNPLPRALFLGAFSLLLASPVAAGVIASTNFTDGSAANSRPAVTWSPTISLLNVPPGNPNNSVYTAASGTVDVGNNGAFLGTYVDQSQADSTSLSAYRWQFVAGAIAPTGNAGIPLVAAPATKYFHVAFGTSSSGANFTLSPTLATTFVGSAVTVSPTAPAAASGYTWTAWNGLAPDGTGQGLANAGGTYFHIAYGTSAAGAGFTQTPGVTTTYVGTYVDNTAVDSANPAAYIWRQWSTIAAANGIPGQTAASQTYYLHIKHSQNRGVAFTASTGEVPATYPAPPGILSSGINLSADFSAVAPATTAWNATMSTPILTISNAETDLAKLNVSFDLVSNRIKRVLVRIYSYPATGTVPNGFREGLVRPVGVNALYRYSIDLNNMTPGTSLGGTDFQPGATRVQFAFIMPGSTAEPTATWEKIASNYVRVDNICYTSPSYYAAPIANVVATNTGLTQASPQTLDYIMPLVQPGDVVCLNPGTYTNANINTSYVIPLGGVSGTPSRWITIRPTNKASPPVLRTLGWNALEIWSDSSYIDVQGLTFKGYYDGEGGPDATANQLSVALAGADGAQLNTYPGYTTNPAYTVYPEHNLSATQRYVARFTDFYGNPFTASVSSGVPVNGAPATAKYNSGAIYINGRNTSNGLRSSFGNQLLYESIHHIRIADCIIFNYPAAGISTTKADYLYIENNFIYDNNKLSRYGTSGLSTLTAVNFDGSTGFKTFMIANTSANNGGNVRWGPRVDTDASGRKTINIDFSDGNGIILDSLNNNFYTGKTLLPANVLYDNGGGGVHCFKTDNVVMVNNTAFHNAKNNSAPSSWVGARYVAATAHTGAANAGPYATYTTTAGKVGGSSLNYAQIDTRASNNITIHNNILWAFPGRKINDAMAAGSNVTYTHNVFGRDGGFTVADENTNAVWRTNAALFATSNKVLYTATAADIFANSTIPTLLTFLHLKTTGTVSPALNGGGLTSTTPIEDRLGVARPKGAAVDIGAYEDL